VSEQRRRALISVYEKEGVEHLARGLHELGFELVSSGGTAAHLEELGLPVTRVEDVTGAPELLGGRVKTLHPNIHAGILARRDRDDDTAALAEQGIAPFDVVCVNLYPFAKVAARLGPTEDETIEMIDVGGPSMLRAAAKNFAHVAAVSDTRQYEVVLRELGEHGEVTLETRRRLAAEAFATTAAYEASIAEWFARGERFPEQLTLSFRKVSDLPYGENPHQAAAVYWEVGARKHLLSRVEQLGGRELSYNNLADLEGARRVIRELSEPAAVIVKHANPCGVAIAKTIEEAWERALAADPVSAFGCVAILNRPVPTALGERIAEHFVEVLLAPEYEDGALAALARKPALRILQDAERRADTPGERDFKRVVGGLLVQDRDADTQDREGMHVATGEVTDEAWADLLFAWRVCKHVSSNAIVLARDGRTIGIGAGQMSRVDAVRIAVEKAHELGHETRGAVLASDAFFPFADGPQLALGAGITAIVQPGGSKRDAEVCSAVEAAGAAMVLTGRRHFRH
jgi:phosphoribosylaminoimidazolecarboxamide formyltransferase/IMP cyclohydrolase